MNRGDVFLVDLGGRAGKRPAVVLTRDGVLGFLNKVTVAEITSQGKGYPTEVSIGTQANLPRESVVQADNLHTVSRQRLDRYMGTLPDPVMDRISEAVVLALGLENTIGP